MRYFCKDPCKDSYIEIELADKEVSSNGGCVDALTSKHGNLEPCDLAITHQSGKINP